MSNKDLEQAGIEMALFPTRHRENVGTRLGLMLEVFGACEIEGCQGIVNVRITRITKYEMIQERVFKKS